MVNEVEKYIANQKEHHKKMTYEEEINLFITNYGLKIINRYNGYDLVLSVFNPRLKSWAIININLLKNAINVNNYFVSDHCSNC